jgi:eukaryotic-like serine/threonine-protein kinase
MAIPTTDDVLSTLQTSGLLAPDRFEALARDVAPLGDDLAAALKVIVKRKHVTVYQLKKALNNRGADLFVGPFVVLDKVGEGAMGKVFRARDTRDGRTVALKVVRAALLSNPVIRGRYEREVQATSKLDHPHIVRTLDAGEADGKFYMAMEFVDGIDLSRLMKDCGALEVAEACEYVRQAALGLQHAHDCGFVHRDVKPSNIVVAGERHVPQATEPAVVKLLDLGLSRALDPDEMVAPNLTRDHTVVGTPDYMAPEQAKNSKAVDTRADLYSLGCTFYYLLAGRVPFAATTAIEKILAHHSEVATPIQALRPQVPNALAELVARLMAKNPDDRPQTAAEVAVRLEPFVRYAADAQPVNLRTGYSAEPSSHGSGGPLLLPLEPSGSSVGPSPLFELVGDEPAVPPSKPPRPDDTARASDAPTLPNPPPVPPPAPEPRRRWLWPAVAGVGFALLALALWLLLSQ